MTALTPAQVRDHARALLKCYGTSKARKWISDELEAPGVGGPGGLVDDEYDEAWEAIADAIRTARITVDWDEEIR